MYSGVTLRLMMAKYLLNKKDYYHYNTVNSIKMWKKRWNNFLILIWVFAINVETLIISETVEYITYRTLYMTYV